ncbi:hypothetical protein FHS55_001280 [Angulomicrobium tetraedrale]|uniref:Uncharacterized protein n=1 Tax=Ancylobacter tetraedralis TaxID=217068 RepID=A0A839Z8Q5_9HYPH|nr:hypothetical protein [Ancylobacter tetraedralis]MBB3770685.1 hypothetical protein [Ancylobacter tetraedralis]
MNAVAATALQRIRLHLARSKEFPEGSARHGYEFVAPLDARGHIDLEGWKAARAACLVTRFWGNDAPESGHLVHRAGGARGATWIFDYEEGTSEDDEAGYRFADHAFAPGEYVSLREEDGALHTFVVFSVVPA